MFTECKKKSVAKSWREEKIVPLKFKDEFYALFDGQEEWHAPII